MTHSADTNSATKVVEHALRKDTSGGSDHFEITLKFVLAAQLSGDINAEELQVIDAIATASQAVVPLDSTPTAAGILNSTVDTSQKVVTEIQTFNNTWGVLLKRMELFNKIVADIAQVFCTAFNFRVF